MLTWQLCDFFQGILANNARKPYIYVCFFVCLFCFVFLFFFFFFLGGGGRGVWTPCPTSGSAHVLTQILKHVKHFRPGTCFHSILTMSSKFYKFAYRHLFDPIFFFILTPKRSQPVWTSKKYTNLLKMLRENQPLDHPFNLR